MKSLFSDPQCARAMDYDEVNMLLRVLIAEKAGLFRPSKADVLFSNSRTPVPGIIQIMIGRLRLAEADLEYSEGIILVLADLADGNPGRAVMLAHELVQATLRYGKCVDVEYFSHDLCLWGYPTDKAFEEAWASQKVGSANWLDTTEAWHG